MSTTPTVFIVDDNAAFRASTRFLLSGSGHDVFECGDAEQALLALRQHSPAIPACALLDVRMPGMSGLELHTQLGEHGVQVPVIYMTGHGDVALAVQAMQRGAVSFLEKPFADEALERALASAFQASSADGPARHWESRLARLTRRERQVLDLVLHHRLNKQIADDLGISISTVELHRANMMQKLGAKSAGHLIKMATSGRAA